jgi:hypothetical protein
VRTFALYYWKEWRDHRAVVIGFAIAMPMLLGLAGALLESRIYHGQGTQLFIVAASLLVATLAIGADLVPGEARRGRLEFLRRLPCDLHLAYLGKLAFLLSAYVLFPAYSSGVAWLVGQAVGPEPTPAVEIPGWVISGGLALVLWAFVVSCWLPRGTLAVPAAALVLGLFALPVVLACLRYRTLDIQADWLVVLAAAAPVVGWWSFAGGRRLGRGIGASAWRGLLALALLFAPAYGRTALDLHRLFHLDPHGAHFVMESGWLGEGNRYAFVNVAAHGAKHAVVIDLSTGEWRRDGAVGDRFDHAARRHLPGASRVKTPLPLVMRVVESQHGPMGYWCTYLDGATAEPIKSGWTAMRLDGIEPRLQAMAAAPPRAEDVLAHTPNGAPLLRVGDRLARRDGSEFTFADGVRGAFSVVGVPDEETVILICNRNQVVRVRFGSDACEVLFPR